MAITVTNIGFNTGDTITYTTPGAASAIAMSAFYVVGLDGSTRDVQGIAGGSSTTPSVTSGVPIGAREFFIGMVSGKLLTTSFTQDSTNASWASPPGQISIAAPVLGGGVVLNTGSGALTYAPTFGSTDSW